MFNDFRRSGFGLSILQARPNRSSGRALTKILLSSLLLLGILSRNLFLRDWVCFDCQGVKLICFRFTISNESFCPHVSHDWRCFLVMASQCLSEPKSRQLATTECSCLWTTWTCQGGVWIYCLVHSPGTFTPLPNCAKALLSNNVKHQLIMPTPSCSNKRFRKDVFGSHLWRPWIQRDSTPRFGVPMFNWHALHRQIGTGVWLNGCRAAVLLVFTGPPCFQYLRTHVTYNTCVHKGGKSPLYSYLPPPPRFHPPPHIQEYIGEFSIGCLTQRRTVAKIWSDVARYPLVLVVSKNTQFWNCMWFGFAVLRPTSFARCYSEYSYGAWCTRWCTRCDTLHMFAHIIQLHTFFSPVAHLQSWWYVSGFSSKETTCFGAKDFIQSESFA